MKKIYENVQIELLIIAEADIITLSPNQKDDTTEDIFGDN